MKTKLGISVPFMAAGVFFIALLGGYTPVLLVAGYILLKEENDFLRHCAIKAVVTLTVFYLASTVIGLLPDAIDWLNSLTGLVLIDIPYGIRSWISDLASVFTSALYILRVVAFGLMGLKALKVQEIKMPVIDKLIEKYEAKKEEEQA